MAVAILALAGCEHSPTRPKFQPGSFQATISGAISTELQGSAWMDVDPLFGPEVRLVVRGAPYEIRIFRGLIGASPFHFEVGTHPAGSLFSGGVVDVVMNGGSYASGDFYMATAGEVRITESVADHVTGELDVNALADPSGAQQVIRLRGTFVAPIAN